MPINLTWDSQDAIPDGLQNFAVERDGKFVFEAETLQEVANLKKTAKSERDLRTKYEPVAKKAERFKALLDAEDDEIEQFLEGWQKRGENTPKPDPDASKQLELKDKLHQREIKKREDELALLKMQTETMSAELREFKLWTPLREVAIKADLMPEDWDLARLELASQKRFDFDDDGKIVLLEDGVPSNVSPERFFKEVYSEQRPKFYRASGASGSGATNGNKPNNNAKTMKRSAFQSLTPSEQMAAVKKGVSVVD